ncbi:gluconokinase [Rhizobium bangladeshense]|uniref:gluconokinase n=1 Tax=Rhizobium TaxID=379 RepID=UPI001107258C|nr:MULTISPECIES: gluconokinase [Rhizobium]QSY95070.1 gluconokinase [Rhizobium bangladeshense]TLX13339.1 gluconokinase [Rhizobium sp. MHM7A]
MQDDTMNKPHAIIVMGVSGCGKSSVGEKLAEALRLDFLEGDALHPASNVEKMSKGIPLTDEDRMPWLDLIGKRMQASLKNGEGIIVSCSALKRIYRDRLRAAAGGNLFFVYLEGSKALLTTRMGERRGHFMPLSLLESQLATLEVPTGEPGVVTVDIDDTVDGIAATALRDLSTLGVTA